MDDQMSQPDGISVPGEGLVSTDTVSSSELTYTNNVHCLGSLKRADMPWKVQGESSSEPLIDKQPMTGSELDPSDNAGPAQVSLEGSSECLNQIRNLISKVAKTNASVLILGQSGTGKEVAAREIHRNSLRANKPFVPINCGAIPPDLLESELFGHEKGAFTGALTARPGRFEMAEGGTLFLDEIGDMSLDMQVKLLRVLQEHTFERVGSNKTRVADVRIIAATHRNLEERILQNQFREDLYYRLNVFPIEMPQLRDRKEDIAVLLQSMIDRQAGERSDVKFSDEAIAVLKQYNWPGNIRELSNVVERICILHSKKIIGTGELPQKILDSCNKLLSPENHSMDEIFKADMEPADFVERLIIPSEGVDLKELLTKLELHYIKLALRESDGVVARAAKLLRLGRTTLVEKLRKYELGRAA